MIVGNQLRAGSGGSRMTHQQQSGARSAAFPAKASKECSWCRPACAKDLLRELFRLCTASKFRQGVNIGWGREGAGSFHIFVTEESAV